VAKDFFNSTIKMEIVNQIEEVERMGKKEHVVFLITPVFLDKVCTENALSPTLDNLFLVYVETYNNNNCIISQLYLTVYYCTIEDQGTR